MIIRSKGLGISAVDDLKDQDFSHLPRRFFPRENRAVI